MVLKFYTSVAKRLKLKVRKFKGLISTFVEVTGEECLELKMFYLHFWSWKLKIMLSYMKLVLSNLTNCKHLSKNKRAYIWTKTSLLGIFREEF